MAGARLKGARVLHDAFEASLLLKGAFAASEALLGLALYLVPGAAITGAVRWLTTHELTEDPNDLIARHLMDAAQSMSISTQDFYAVYLLGHGLLKLAVVLLLVRGYLWAYPLAVAVLSGFILYQVHRFLLAPSWALVALTVLDAVVIALTLVEYRARRTAAQGGLAPAGESGSD
ncbi:DUF2127 domain-containing protein [Palleronia sp. KMU-117]|uniref:DUF2127 domain-containing protein n=1 Tax=Palleronia sp. KMU-117 TaxID=3434108 RepID=UPI003D70F6BB